MGSLGRLGVLVEVAFKVFPAPLAWATLRVDYDQLDDALAGQARLAAAPLDIEALDLEPFATGARLWVRIGGLAEFLPPRLKRLQGLLGRGEALMDTAEASYWRDVREFHWTPAGWHLLKAPLTPGRIPALEAALAGSAVRRRYSAGGNVAWLAAPGDLDALEALLAGQGLPALLLRGPAGRSFLGAHPDNEFARRVKQTLDPAGRFPPL